MHSTAQAAPAASEIFNETASTGDALIRLRKQPLRPLKSSTKLLPLETHGFDSANSPCGVRNLQRNCFHWCRMDSTAQRAHVGFEIINKNSVAPESEMINETASTGDACIRQRKQPLRPQKYSSKLLPRMTHAFDSVSSPCGLRNLQRNCFHG